MIYELILRTVIIKEVHEKHIQYFVNYSEAIKAKEALNAKRKNKEKEEYIIKEV